MKNKILKTLFFVWLLCFWINQSNAELSLKNDYYNITCEWYSSDFIQWSDPLKYFLKNNLTNERVIPCYKVSNDYSHHFVRSHLYQNIYYWDFFYSNDYTPPCSDYISYIDLWLGYCVSWFINANYNQMAIEDFWSLLTCTNSDEVLTLNWNTYSCIVDSWWDIWDSLFWWLTDSLNSIYNSIQSFIQKFTDFANSFNFDFEYTWFNFNINNFYKFLSLNISWNNKPTIYNPTQNTDCKDIFNYTTVYYDINKGWAPDCNDSTFWQYPSWSFDFVINNWNDWNDDGWIYPVNSYLWKYQLTTDNVNNDWPLCYEYRTYVTQQKFKYITNYNNNNLININTAIFDSLNIIPINLIVFNVNVTSYINSTAVYILKLTISIFATPIEFINKLFSSFNLFNLDFKDNTNYCFAWGLWRMPSKANTPSVTISNNTNWVNGAWVELFLFLILAFNCFHTFMKLKKQFN